MLNLILDLMLDFKSIYENEILDLNKTQIFPQKHLEKRAKNKASNK